MPRKCAYCDSPGPLTREHIWPRGIIERLPTYRSRFTGRGKVIRGESTIADVCEQCNNGPLSALDAYICELFDRYFARICDCGTQIEFEYDWSRLGKWLLKASYNAARAASNVSDAATLSRFADCILGKDARPPDLAIIVDLVEPSYLVTPTETGILTARDMRPEMVRFCSFRPPGFCLDHYKMRIVGINSFYFYLVIPVAPYSDPHFSDLAELCELFCRMTALDPDCGRATCKTTGISFATIIAPHCFAHEDAYRTSGLYPAK